MGEEGEDTFPPEECERRLAEVMRRLSPGVKPTFNLSTGQNYGEPQLSEAELLRRGYDPSTVDALKKYGFS